MLTHAHHALLRAALQHPHPAAAPERMPLQPCVGMAAAADPVRLSDLVGCGGTASGADRLNGVSDTGAEVGIFTSDVPM
jgi:hypothetical protein